MDAGHPLDRSIEWMPCVQGFGVAACRRRGVPPPRALQKGHAYGPIAGPCLGPYSRAMPRALWWSLGGGRASSKSCRVESTCVDGHM